MTTKSTMSNIYISIKASNGRQVRVSIYLPKKSLSPDIVICNPGKPGQQ